MSTDTLTNPRTSINLEALGFWQQVLTLLIREQSLDLTTRQTAILLTIYLDSPPHSIKSLAQQFDISKAAVCRAIDTLSTQGLVKRKRDDNDKRLVYIQRTVKGSVFLSEFSSFILQSTNRMRNKTE